MNLLSTRTKLNPLTSSETLDKHLDEALNKPLDKKGNESLSDWLALLEQRHPSLIDLGLERVAEVATRLGLNTPKAKVITVAGTNGKGSCVAIIEALLTTVGIRVGTFTSPHLLAYNERIRIDAENSSDADICRAFVAIEQARGDISLTYFEFSALAALWLFAETELDIIVLEVGLGGRLDAVNIIDPDVAVITSIDLDHQQWLGDNRSVIALEKAGIARSGVPLICADPNPPDELLVALDTLGADLILLGQEGFTRHVKQHFLTLVATGRDGQVSTFTHLPIPQVPLTSAVCAVQALLALGQGAVGVSMPDILSAGVVKQVFAETRIAGRFQRSCFRERQLILDVAHNPAAATLLAKRLAALGASRVHCVFGVLADKDITGIITPLLPLVSRWHVCELPDVPRAAAAGEVAALVYNYAQSVEDAGLALSDSMIRCYDNPEQALGGAVETSVPGDMIVVFGSFYTVAAVLKNSGEGKTK